MQQTLKVADRLRDNRLGYSQQICGFDHASSARNGHQHVELTELHSPADLFGGGSPDQPQTKLPISPKIEISPDSILRAVSPEASDLVAQQLEMVQLLQKRPYMLMSPYIMTTR